MKQFLSLLAIAVLFLTSCETGHKKKEKHVNASVYTTTVVNSTPNTDDDFIYWYIIMADNGGCYTYSSPTQVNSFTGVNWSYSSSMPSSLSGVQSQPVEISQSELTSEVSESTTEASEASEGDGGGEGADGSGEGGGDGGGDSGGDSGGGDSGGGDGGGGDGGGGGD